MFTVRQIERSWRAEDYASVARRCLEMRPEHTMRMAAVLSAPPAAAALAVIRMDELGQTHLPFCAQLVRRLLDTQESDGGWGDCLTTAVCVRALLCGRGEGLAIEKALRYLANLQRSEGLWPRIPIRRTPGDVFVSAGVLLMLGTVERFRRAVQLDAAIRWFECNREALDVETARIWRLAAARMRAPAGVGGVAEANLAWS